MEKVNQPHSHMVVMPKPFIAIRAAQLLLGVVLLGLSGYLVSIVTSSISVPGSFALTLFTAIVTLIISVYFIVSTLAAPAIYNKWAYLALEIFMVVFWLSSMASMAAYRASFRYAYYGYIYKRDAATRSALNIMTGAAVLSAFEMVLFVVSLVFFGINLHQNLQQGNSNAGHFTTGDNMQAVPQNHPAMHQQQQQQQAAQYPPQPIQVQQPSYPPQYQQPPAPPPAAHQPQYMQPQPNYQQPQPGYQQPIQSDQEKIAVDPATQTQPQYHQQPPYPSPYSTITPVASPPPQ